MGIFAVNISHTDIQLFRKSLESDCIDNGNPLLTMMLQVL